MSERSYINNGRMLHNLDGWSSASALYSPSDGDDHYGMASLSTGGGYIEQQFTVPRARSYTLHLSVKPTGSPLSGSQATARIVDGSGATVLTQALTGSADTWNDQQYTIGLAPGTAYTLRVTNASAASTVKIDDVWLWWVPKTRAQLAAEVARKLVRLAADRGLTTTLSGTQTEGSYTDPVDAGLRRVGAVNEETDLPDVRYLDASLLDACLEAIELAMLERLHRDYLLEVDIAAEDRRESLGQIAKAIAGLTGGRSASSSSSSGGSVGGAASQVVMRRLFHRADDYEMGA